MEDPDLIEFINDKISYVVDDLNKKGAEMSIGETSDLRGKMIVRLQFIEGKMKVDDITTYFSKNGFTMLYLPIPIKAGYYIVLEKKDIERLRGSKATKDFLNSIINNRNTYILGAKFVLLVFLFYVLYFLITKW